MKTTSFMSARSVFTLLTLYTATAVLMTALSGCREFLSHAKGTASDIKCEPGMGVINNEADAGINVKVTVTNVGDKGFINIRPELSTSEGEWSRSQDLQFNKDESKSLTYFFHEPTIMADNIQCRVGISPEAGD